MKSRFERDDRRVRFWPADVRTLGKIIPYEKARPAGLYTLGRSLVVAFIKHNDLTLAAAIAFYTLLSVFPLVLGILAIVGVVTSDPATRAHFVDVVAAIFPAGSDDLIRATVRDVVAGRSTAGIVATVFLIFSGSGFLGAITQALDLIWDVPHQRNLIVTFVLAVALELGIGIIFIVSLGLSAVLELALNYRLPILGFSLATLPLLVTVAGVIVPLAITFGLFLAIYLVGPNLKLTVGCTVPGAAFAALTFEISKQAFAVYLTTFAHLNSIYGSIGAVIALASWAFVAAIVLLLGAELNAAIARRRGLCGPGRVKSPEPSRG